MNHIGASKELLAICNAALDTYGSTHQVMKNIEEMSESITELLKYMQAEGREERIIDELADVLITTIQMMIVFGDKKVQERVNYKAVRLMTKIKKKQEEIGGMH